MKNSSNPIGYPSRDGHGDLRAGFAAPPPGYGEVPFYWWQGDRLTKERLAWQLDQLAPIQPSGIQVNYAHSDKGGCSYGLTMPSDPPLFSDEWWTLFEWWAGECNKRGIAVSLSDYTLGIVGQGYWMDEILAEDPSLTGRCLFHEVREAAGNTDCSLQLPEHTISVMAYRVENGTAVPETATDLRTNRSDGDLRWHVPTGDWRVIMVYFLVNPHSIDPLNPKLGPRVIATFFQRFENHLPGRSGTGLNFFFSDELNFGAVSGNMWTDRFADEFKKRKGYDLIPLLPALFTDIGPMTPKVRLDYSDVLVALTEEAYFKPLFQWHQERGMLFGCDHGARGQSVTEFGDYFRTMRWMSGPGCDQHGGIGKVAEHVVKNKVASSIAHLYRRPRVWLEGFHASGWGTSTTDLTRGVVENFVAGQNLLSLHGLYYTLYGGWWEWSPPCNHFRMPYWPHMTVWMVWLRRVSYLMSQGIHRCDVAILYPVAPMEAGMEGATATTTAFEAGTSLFEQGMDFDFMDFESLADSRIEDRTLRISDESYKVLILPAMTAVRHSTMEQALAFFRAGGVVIALDALPEASDRAGRDDPDLDAMVGEIFGVNARGTTGMESAGPQRNAAGGVGMYLRTGEHLFEILSTTIRRDFESPVPCRVNHRKIGERDVYMLTRVPRNTECFFRAKGMVELWDPWTGTARPLAVISSTEDGTRLRMPLDTDEAQFIVFNPGEPSYVATVPAQPDPVTSILSLDGPWEFELKPTMDNHWGDFRMPPSEGCIGAEARFVAYADESLVSPDTQTPPENTPTWRRITCGFGPRFWKLGPLPAGADTRELEGKLSAVTRVDATIPVEMGGKKFFWQPYAYSLRQGVEGDPGHQGYWGLKKSVTDDFIGIGQYKPSPRYALIDSVYERETPDAGSYFLWTAILSPGPVTARVIAGGLLPSAAWLGGQQLTDFKREVQLPTNRTPLLLRYDTTGRGHFLLQDASAPTTWEQPHPLAMSWYLGPGVLTFDCGPARGNTGIGWYRFTSPPGLNGMNFAAHGRVQAWAHRRPAVVRRGDRRDDGAWNHAVTIPEPDPQPVEIILRIEQEPGYYAGAALPDPIALSCGPGLIDPGDWSTMDGLETYSGGAWYRKTVHLKKEMFQNRVVLDLGNVTASGEVHVNGVPAGVKLAPPWRLDITDMVHPGDNRIEILVYNTLANHYLTVPTRFRGRCVSGLLGPIHIEYGRGET